jgi:hypothetical protein
MYFSYQALYARKQITTGHFGKGKLQSRSIPRLRKRPRFCRFVLIIILVLVDGLKAFWIILSLIFDFYYSLFNCARFPSPYSQTAKTSTVQNNYDIAAGINL